MSVFKLGIRFSRSGMIKRFLANERTGFYFAVLQEGEVGVGDQIELIEGNKRRVRGGYHPTVYTREAQHRIASSRNCGRGSSRKLEELFSASTAEANRSFTGLTHAGQPERSFITLALLLI